jgi:DUF2075 family protein
LRLYSGSSQQFISDSIQNQVAEKLKSTFFGYYRYYPSPSEVASWRNSLRAMSQVIQYAGIKKSGVLLEYQLPLSSKRLDCMFTGIDRNGTESAIIVELKQWEKCEASDGENEVTTWVGGALRDVLHPSAQVGQYRSYLEDVHTAFYEGENPVQLGACAYLHNYQFTPDDELLSVKFDVQRKSNPVFTGDDVDELASHIANSVDEGDGLPVLARIEQSEYRPSKKLMDHIGHVIKGKSAYVLLDEQLVAYDKVLAAARKGFQDKKKRSIIIKGGPGTGKSVIALNLMADLLLNGHNAHYATGSRAFTETLRKIIGPRGSIQFKYFNSYMSAEANEVDVLISDEAHRIRETSNNRFTKAENKSNVPQIEELMRVAKVGVYLIDDDQIVRPNEIGSAEVIRTNANLFGHDVQEFELEAQFRCNGSDAFVNWINNTLRIRQTANAIWTGKEGFEFKIFDTPEILEGAIREQAKSGHSARLTAGFCWPWSKPNGDGSLVADVEIGNFQRPWNARPNAGRLAKGIPKSSFWATDPNGINQVGCVYTAQGFEFDYVGVIWGSDLSFDFELMDWVGNKSSSFDTVVKRSKDQFLALVKNTYRVLLTRGLKGCYVCFIDKETENFVRSRIEEADFKEDLLMVADEPGKYGK